MKEKGLIAFQKHILIFSESISPKITAEELTAATIKANINSVGC